MADWDQRDSADVLRQLGVEPTVGLADAEVSKRLQQYGPNELVGTGVKTVWRVLWEQLTSLLVLILIVAATISALIRDYEDAVAIGAIVLLNTALGFTQEYRAERSLAALRKLAVPSVRARRNSEMKNVAVATIVPGDVVLLEAGNFVAADCRVLEGVDLQTQESALTGESAPIHKTQERLDQANLPLGDRRNMVYRGTFVTAGRGLAVVVATGMKTELGRIAGLVQSVTRETIPLERRLEELGRRLALIALCVVVVIFVFGLIRGEELKLMFLTAVSIGVAAIPEGLPAAVTITLALGAKRMLKRKALIRKLSAIETLGSVTVICSDKTGTLTKSQMSVAVLALADRSADFSTFLQSNTDRANLKSSGFGLLLAGAVLCNDSVAAQSDLRDGSLVLLGDPTENAFVTAASQMDLSKTSLDRLMPRVGEIPFSSERKRMTTIHQLPSAPVPFPLGQLIGAIPGPGTASGHVAFTKGAPSTLLDASSHIWVDGKREILSDSWRARLTSVADDFAGRGMRILAVACRLLDGLPAPADETL